MARTQLLRILQGLSRRCAASADARSPVIGRRMILAGGAGTLLTGILPAGSLAANTKIAVVGAGLAGLTAAYELQKAGYQADVFEANTRVGGRCYSARGHFANAQIAEHGGEFIDSEHREIRALAQELGLALDDVLVATPPGTRMLSIFDGRPYSLKEATKDWQPLYPLLQEQAASLGEYNYRASNPIARRFDAMTIAGWVAAHVPGGRSSQLGRLIESAFEEENAADADQQSALNVIPVLAADPQDNFNLYGTESDQRFHVRGGNDLIPKALAQRIGRKIHMAMPLIAIARLGDGRIRLSFRRENGRIDQIYDKVILALPFSVMRASVDFVRAEFQPLKLQAIRSLPIGPSVKFQLQFNRRAWTDVGSNGEIRLESKYFQTTWEVTRAQPGTSGILNFFSGGTRARNAGLLPAAKLAQAVMRDIEPLVPGISSQWNGRFTKDAWAENPWSYGSYSYFPPGYQTSLAGIESEPEGNCFFAGEHTAAQNGYMNAGVESGMRAARQLAASLQ